jgi:hypothetical protein
MLVVIGFLVYDFIICVGISKIKYSMHHSNIKKQKSEIVTSMVTLYSTQTLF